MQRFAFLAGLLVCATASAQFWPFPDNDPKPVRSSAAKLPALNANAQAVSVSGISAGAYLATQLQVAYSATFMGVGSIAGGPWNCSEGSVITAQTACMAITSSVNPKALANELKAEAKKNAVDSLDNLKSARVYIYNSPSDGVVRAPMNEKTREFYSSFVDEANIKTETSINSAHGFPTLDYGLPCSKQGDPYIINCKFDAAGEMMKHIYAGATLSRGTAVAKSLVTFDQTEFGGDSIMFAEKGYAYIPQACRAAGAKCAVHVALHGCLQALENIQEKFVQHTGYNEWAEGSNIIVLYPQAKSGSGNPNACFDWWGFTGDNYATRDGAQMKAIKAMIDRVTGS